MRAQATFQSRRTLNNYRYHRIPPQLPPNPRTCISSTGKGEKDRVTLISDDLRLPLDVYTQAKHSFVIDRHMRAPSIGFARRRLAVFAPVVQVRLFFESEHTMYENMLSREQYTSGDY